MKNFRFLFIGMAAVFFITSCQNTPTYENTLEVSIAEDEVEYIVTENALGEEITAASYGSYLADHSSKGDWVFFRPNNNFPHCAEVTVSSDTFPKEIIIDFGEECLTRNGRLRSGTNLRRRRNPHLHLRLHWRHHAQSCFANGLASSSNRQQNV